MALDVCNGLCSVFLLGLFFKFAFKMPALLQQEFPLGGHQSSDLAESDLQVYLPFPPLTTQLKVGLGHVDRTTSEK